MINGGKETAEVRETVEVREKWMSGGCLGRVRTLLGSSCSAEQFCEAVFEARKELSELQDASVQRHVFQSVVEYGDQWLTCEGPSSAARGLLHSLSQAVMLEVILSTLPGAG